MLAKSSFLYGLLGEEDFIGAKVMFEYLAEKSHHASFLFLVALPLQGLLKVP